MSRCRVSGQQTDSCSFAMRKVVHVGVFDGRHHLVQGIRELRAIDIDPLCLARIVARLRPSGDGCTLYRGAHNGDGYAVAAIVRGKHGRVALVHRVAYALAHGTAPADRVLDHFLADRGLCHGPGCSNPDHLRATFSDVNTPGIFYGEAVGFGD